MTPVEELFALEECFPLNDCTHCNASGEVFEYDCRLEGTQYIAGDWVTCSVCDGKGKTP